MPVFITPKKLESEIARRVSEACDHIESEMGAEIHDDLVQKLSIFRLYLDQMERASVGHSEIEGLVIKMRGDFEHVIRVVKSISRRLLPVYTEGDTLANMVEMLCQNLEIPGTGHVHFESNGQAKLMDAHSEIYILRIIQELIQNAFKHSAAWHVWVRLTWDDAALVIEVEDDGSGFSRISEFIGKLRKKNNSLKMRTTAISAGIEYLQGMKGLLARVTVPLEP